MTAVPLILKGHLKIGTAAMDAADVSDEVTQFAIKAMADTVEIPATLATPKSARKGAMSHELTIAYLSSDASGTLFSTLWDIQHTDDGLAYFEGSMRAEAVSDDNPLWSGFFIVTESEVGGEAEGLSASSATFPMTDAPSRDDTES